MKRTIWSGLFVSLVCLSFFAVWYRLDDSSATPVEAIEHVRSEIGPVLGEFDTATGKIVFYLTDFGQSQGINAEFVRKTLKGWKWGVGGGHSIPQDEIDIHNIDSYMSFQYFPGTEGTEFGRSPFPMIYGVVKHLEIAEIRITSLKNNDEIQAKWIHSNQKFSIWYAFLSDAQGRGLMISALSRTGTVIGQKRIHEQTSAQSR